MKNASQPYSEFEIELIKQIPSNIFVGYVTGRDPGAVCVKRATTGAPPSRSYGLKKAKRLFKAKYEEIAAKFNQSTAKAIKEPKIVKLVQSSTSFTIMVNDKLVTVHDGDKIVTEADGIYLKKKI